MDVRRFSFASYGFCHSIKDVLESASTTQSRDLAIPDERANEDVSLAEKLGRTILKSGWKLLLISLLGLVALQPLLRPAMTCSDDGGHYLVRLVELDHCLRQGTPWPRWTPDLVYGYGYPLFNFFPPLSFYPAEFFHLLGLSFAQAWNAALALYILLAGMTMYLLVKDLFGETAAWVAAVAYMYAPYQLYNALNRGNLGEALALPLLPLTLWAFRRLLIRGETQYDLVKRRRSSSAAYRDQGAAQAVPSSLKKPLAWPQYSLSLRSRPTRPTLAPLSKLYWGEIGYLVLSALSYAALILTHNVISLIFTPFLLLYVGALWLLKRGTARSLSLISAALLLALGLSACFWLPAFFEKRWVKIHLAYTPAGMNYRYNFLSLGELLSLPIPVHTSLMNPAPPRSLGLVQLALALLAMAGWWGAKNEWIQNCSKGIAKSPLLAWIWQPVLSLPKESRPSRKQREPLINISGSLASEHTTCVIARARSARSNPLRAWEIASLRSQ